MLISIPNVLGKDDVARFRQLLDAADWRDGRITAGSLARAQKHNLQLDDAAEPAASLSHEIVQRLGTHPLFISAALPGKIHPPRFNRYVDGGTYGAHIDSALMRVPGSGITLRTDLSATLFLSEPAEYDGGELQIEGPFGVQAAKLAAGDLMLYPASSLHQVTPVTRGARVAAFLWVESFVRDAGERTLLFDLDQTIQSLSRTLPATDPQLVRLTGVYYNLLRRWCGS